MRFPARWRFARYLRRWYRSLRTRARRRGSSRRVTRSRLPQTSAASRAARVAPPEPPATDWEAVIGGNWLNKLGMFVLVIGMALALGLLLPVSGPAGRVAISAAASIAMIVAGAAFEPRDRYRTFARGLIGGGWAALYFTAYAMYAVDSARVIDNPVVAAVLLMAVATGMILHRCGTARRRSPGSRTSSLSSRWRLPK